MSDLLERIRGEIRDRMTVCEAAVAESRTLEAMLTALDGRGASPTASTSAAAPASSAAAKPRSKRASRRSDRSSARAPRGANRAVVLRVLGERPGVSVSELSVASGVQRSVLYALLKQLQERGEVVKHNLPGGTTGFALAPGDAASDTLRAAQDGGGGRS